MVRAPSLLVPPMNLPSTKPRRSLLRRPTVMAVLFLLAAAWLAFELRPGPPPEVTVSADRPGIGRGTTLVTVEASAPGRGLAGLEIAAVQGDRVAPLGGREHTAPPAWAFWRSRTRNDRLEVAVGRDAVPGLEAGEVVVRVTARRAQTLLRRPDPVVVDTTLPVRLVPPSLGVVSQPNYAKQGGSGLVVYRVGETALETGGRDGVQSGDWFFPGRPLPGGTARERFALYGIPYDLDSAERVRLVASDGLGNEAFSSFLSDLTRVPFETDDIEINDRFMSQVVPEILAQTPSLTDRGTLLDNYLEINGGLRRENAETLVALGQASQPAFLWEGAFRQLPNSQVTSSFADRRTYRYQDRAIDQQDHLGFDLASVRRAPVPASGGGAVVLARYFGIYGNTVVLDHGHGLLSLYSHLSQIDVEEGQTVAQGHVVGRTGATGLAAGDHLHFTMLIGGLAVNPVEWWDPRWVENRILAPLRGDGL